MAVRLNTTDILSELVERKSNAPVFLDPTFPHQTNFINDPAKLKAILTTRRSGKSHGAGLYLFKEAFENAGSTCLYLALTRESAKRILWRNVIKTINRKLNLNCKFNETELSATLPNGSVVYLMGMNSSEDHKQKLLGQKFKLAIIDESASFRTDLRELVYSILKPAMVDENGTIAMIGTPGNLTKGLFYDVTTEAESGWSLHKWSALDNPYMRAEWLKELAEIKETRPLYMETPQYKQMYQGLWAIDDSKLVYKFNPERNSIDTLPPSNYTYVIGLDLGYNDPSAFVVCAYSQTDPTLYIVETFKQSKMDITAVAKKLKQLSKKYNPDRIIVDNANKQAIEEIKRRHDVPLTPAEKAGKQDFIEVMNGELIQGKIKLLPQCTELADEWYNLIWNDKGKKREENAACANHLSDACLYAWRNTYSYLSVAPQPKITPNTQEWYELQAQQMLEHSIRQYQSKKDNERDLFGDW